MAMMTAASAPSGKAPWSRATLERASACASKKAWPLKGAGDDQVECGSEDAMCLARQAGPGPRI
jgi:hypothetical protein